MALTAAPYSSPPPGKTAGLGAPIGLLLGEVHPVPLSFDDEALGEDAAAWFQR